jgi:hypothetical protein
MNESGSRRPRRTSFVLGLVSVVVVIGLVGAAYALTDGFHLNGSTTTAVTVISKWTYDSIPGDQFDAVAFIAHSTSQLNGSFTNSIGIIVYLMTPAELVTLAIKGVISGYNWTSGQIPVLTLYGLNITVTVGPWDLVFLNPDPLNATVIDFWTAVTETPA